jgi:Mrp family chromosome partitioning ATPase
MRPKPDVHTIGTRCSGGHLSLVDQDAGAPVADAPATKIPIAEIMDATLHPRAPAPGFAVPPGERARPLALPDWFVDRCRQAFLAVPFPGPQRIIGITSTAPGEGKTTVALGMTSAVAMDTGEPTLLLECDLETSSDEVLGVSNGPGLSEWLDGDDPLRIVRMPPLGNSFVIPAGGMRPDAARLFYRLSQGDMLGQLQTEFPNIIIDLPPVLSISYSPLAAKITERFFLVARYGATRIEDLEEAMNRLGPERTSGVILNAYAPKTPQWLRRLI